MELREAFFTAKVSTIRRRAGVFYSDLLHSERLPPEQLSQLQWKRAQSIVDFSLRETDFYARNYADNGLTATSELNPEDWSSLPILDRQTVKANAAEMISRQATGRNTRSALTGGSTGEPLKTQHDARVPSLALSWRMYGWWGVQPWDNIARIGRWEFGRISTMRNTITWWPTKQRYMDASLLSPESMSRFHRDINSIRPALIEGYVGSMLAFADFIEAETLHIDPPRALATTAAPLTSSARARLESVFQAPVYDEYRGAEAGWMAGECAEQNGLHIFSDTRLIEVVGKDGTPLAPGETGDIVITDLTNRVFPLIRYRLGDLGTMLDGICACGISLPRMAQPDGRPTDMLRLPGGRSMGHGLLGMFGDHPEAVRQFQIYQQSDYSIVVRVVEGDPPDARVYIEKAVDVLRRRVNGAAPVTIEYVDSLPYTRGKLKYVISDAPASS